MISHSSQVRLQSIIRRSRKISHNPATHTPSSVIQFVSESESGSEYTGSDKSLKERLLNSDHNVSIGLNSLLILDSSSPRILFMRLCTLRSNLCCSHGRIRSSCVSLTKPERRDCNALAVGAPMYSPTIPHIQAQVVGSAQVPDSACNPSHVKV